MLKYLVVKPNERVLVVSPVNRYKVKGPGRVWLTPRQKLLARMYIGPSSRALELDQVRSADNVPLRVSAQIVTHVDPNLLSPKILPNVPHLNEQGWQKLICWHSEYVLRQLIIGHRWRDLATQSVQQRLERQLAATLASRIKVVGLSVMSVNLVNVALPEELQQTLVEAQQTQIQSNVWAEVLERYLAVMQGVSPRTLHLILQWALLDAIRHNNPQILLTSGGLLAGNQNEPSLVVNKIPPDNGVSKLQLQLPLQ